MTAQLPSKVRLAQIASFSKSMALPPSHDEIEAMARALLAAHEQEPVASAAIATLKSKGYTWNGGELWNPPLGPAPDFSLIDRLHSEIDSLKAQLASHPAPVPAVSTREKLAALQLASIINDLGLPENAPFVDITSEIFRLKQLESPVPAVPDDVLTICQRLIKEYIANKGTSSEFICCVTPSRKTIGTGGVWDDWRALDKAVHAAMLNGGKS